MSLGVQRILQHDGSDSVHPMRMVVRSALIRAVDGLLRKRTGEGRWVDYRLPVGVSNQWVSAFVALRLLEVARHLSMRRPAIYEAARQVLSLLREEFDRDSGIGFNATVDPDSDSVAHLVLLGRALEREARPQEIAFLVRHLTDDGGVRTYCYDNAWGASHPCVSAVALRALSQGWDRFDRAAAIGYIAARRLPSGSWPSYWWTSSWYATVQMLVSLSAMGVDIDAVGGGRLYVAPERLTCMEAAWLLDGLCRTTDCDTAHKSDLAAWLLDMQQADGCWPPSRTLRVTEQHCIAPWEFPEGDVYADENGTMTTAVCAAALARYVWFDQNAI